MKNQTFTFEAVHPLTLKKKIIQIDDRDSMFLKSTRRTKEFTCVHDLKTHENIMVREYGRKAYQWVAV